MRKNSAGKQSLSETVTHPYQGLYIDFGFSGKLLFDKDGKVKPGSREDIKGIHGETTYIHEFLLVTHKNWLYSQSAPQVG